MLGIVLYVAGVVLTAILVTTGKDFTGRRESRMRYHSEIREDLRKGVRRSRIAANLGVSIEHVDKIGNSLSSQWGPAAREYRVLLAISWPLTLLAYGTYCLIRKMEEHLGTGSEED